MTSAAVAVTLAARQAGQRGWTIGFAVIAVVFVYTTVANVVERPDGVKIGACFIAAIIARLPGLPAAPAPSSCASPTSSSTPRPSGSSATAPAGRSGSSPTSPTPATRPGVPRTRSAQIRARQRPAATRSDLVFVEVTVGDPSDFEADAARARRGAARPLPRADAGVAPSVPNALAALLLHVRDRTGLRPAHLLRVDRGQPDRAAAAVPPLRPGRGRPGHPRGAARAEPDRARRPHVHVG